MGKIFYLMGKSSSGKDSLFKKIKEKIPELKNIILYTTRPIREGEQNGVEYHFVDENKLQELEKRGCVIEQRAYQTKHGIWKYFTADDGQVDLSQYSYLVIGTLVSYKEMCKYFGKENMIPLYVEVEDGLRLSRALERERQQAAPKYAEMCRRFLADSEDFSEKNLQDAGITKRFQNFDFKKCVSEICDYIRCEKTTISVGGE